MAGIRKSGKIARNEGDGAFATAVAIRELTQEVRHLGERLDKLIALLNQEMIEPGAADTA